MWFGLPYMPNGLTLLQEHSKFKPHSFPSDTHFQKRGKGNDYSKKEKCVTSANITGEQFSSTFWLPEHSVEEVVCTGTYQICGCRCALCADP